MKEDLNLRNDLLSLMNGKELCTAIERDGTICFNEKSKDKNGYINSKYCGKHASRFYKYKSFDLPIKYKEKKSCKFIDCKLTFKSSNKGYCKFHYDKYIYFPKNEKILCSIDGCRNNRSRGLKICAMHKSRLRRKMGIEGNGKKPCHNRVEFKKGMIPKNKGKYKFTKCLVTNCSILRSEKTKIIKGLCSKHYNRWRKFGDYNICSKKEYLNAIKKRS